MKRVCMAEKKPDKNEPAFDSGCAPDEKTKRDDPHYFGHRERLRKKLLNAGGAALADYELLELILMQAIPRKDVKPLAKEILKVFGSFAEAVSAPAGELMKIDGVKEATAALFAVIRESGVRMLKDQVSEAPVLSNWGRMIAYCRAAQGMKKIEVFRVLFLDTGNRLIKDEVLQEGTVNQAMVYPREIAKRALELSAVSLVMVHNHPAGNLKPSKNDISMTKAVEEALNTLGISLLDHVIVAKSGYMSFRESGFLK